jgi:hypothetical protein
LLAQRMHEAAKEASATCSVELPTNRRTSRGIVAELDDNDMQALRSILEGFRALLLTDMVTPDMLSQPAFAELVDATAPNAAMDLVGIIQDLLVALG